MPPTSVATMMAVRGWCTWLTMRSSRRSVSGAVASIAHRQDHGHLRGEGQQAPEALAPGRGHGRQALAFDADGQQHGEQCQRDREDEGSGRYLRISSVKRTPIYSCCLQQTRVGRGSVPFPSPGARAGDGTAVFVWSGSWPGGGSGRCPAPYVWVFARGGRQPPPALAPARRPVRPAPRSSRAARVRGVRGSRHRSPGRSWRPARRARPCRAAARTARRFSRSWYR